jgi:hypothetical protein
VTSIDAPRRPFRLRFRLAAALGLLAAAGCGGPADPFERFPAEGAVTLDGAPLKAGTILFVPEKEGAASTADVKEGAFRLAKSEGLSPGPYRVEVYSVRPTGKKVPGGDDPQTLVDETVNVVPRHYNVQSTLKAEVPPGGPAAPLSFALSSAPLKGAAGKSRPAGARAR